MDAHTSGPAASVNVDENDLFWRRGADQPVKRLEREEFSAIVAASIGISRITVGETSAESAARRNGKPRWRPTATGNPRIRSSWPSGFEKSSLVQPERNSLGMTGNLEDSLQGRFDRFRAERTLGEFIHESEVWDRIAPLVSQTLKDVGRPLAEERIDPSDHPVEDAREFLRPWARADRTSRLLGRGFPEWTTARGTR